MANPSNIMDTTSRIPPLPVVIPNFLPSNSEINLTQASQPPTKRRRPNTRPGVLAREQAPPTRLGSLTACYFDLKNKLAEEFRDKFKSSVGEPGRAETTAQTSQQDPIVDSTTVTSQKRGRLLFMKNSNQNLRGDQPQLTVFELNKKRFKHKYGDRSGIRMWGFHDKLNCWLVKRKTNNVEYYKDKNDFSSLTKVNLAELSEVPFSNPSNDPRATDFKLFSERQVRRGFYGMKTAEYFLNTPKYVFD
uniref:Uncharacterized protein n=1 Tax=Lactuca sativa TaxID=4236 RepID=A0A9R1VX98_LACSA|nr:hypothetical protein LSAT_V11C400222410 [Lactuca sativa]